MSAPGAPDAGAADVLDAQARPRRRGRHAAGAALAVGLLLAAVLLGHVLSPTADPGPAPDPGPAGAAGPGGSPSEAIDNRPDLVRIDERGRVDTTTGAEALERVENPLGVRPPRSSWAVSVRLDDETSWWLLESAPASRSISADPARTEFRTLAAWTADQVAARDAPSRENARPDPGATVVSGLVAFVGPGNGLAPARGVALLAQRAVTGVGAPLVGPAEEAAAAEVRWRGRRWFVLARRTLAGAADYLPFVAAATAPDLDAFLRLARAESGGRHR